ncbi:unnamed protein product, partial [Symbiodinium necroappetens]
RQPRETWPEKHAFAKQLEAALALNVQVIQISLRVWGSVSALPKAMTIDWLKEDPSLRVLFDVMTEAWGEDPPEDADPEGGAPAASLDVVPSDDPYAATDEAGSSHEAEVSPGASHEALSAHPHGLQALLAELNDTGSHEASREALLGEPNGTGSLGAPHEALLGEPNGTGSHGASHEALDSELESIAAKMQVLPSAVADDGKAAGDGHGQEDDESFDVADYEVAAGEAEAVVVAVDEQALPRMAKPDDTELETPDKEEAPKKKAGQSAVEKPKATPKPKTKANPKAKGSKTARKEPEPKASENDKEEEAQEDEKPKASRKPKAKASPKAKGSKTAREEPEPKASGKGDDKKEGAQQDEGTKKRRRLDADDKSFAGRPKPKTDDALNRFMAIRDIYNSKIQLHFGASQQDAFWSLAKPRMKNKSSIADYKKIAAKAAQEFLLANPV